MVVLLRDVVQPLKVTLVQLQVQVQLCQCGLQLGSKQNNKKKTITGMLEALGLAWQDATV